MAYTRPDFRGFWAERRFAGELILEAQKLAADVLAERWDRRLDRVALQQWIGMFHDALREGCDGASVPDHSTKAPGSFWSDPLCEAAADRFHEALYLGAPAHNMEDPAYVFRRFEKAEAMLRAAIDRSGICLFLRPEFEQPGGRLRLTGPDGDAEDLLGEIFPDRVIRLVRHMGGTARIRDVQLEYNSRGGNCWDGKPIDIDRFKKLLARSRFGSRHFAPAEGYAREDDAHTERRGRVVHLIISDPA